MININSQGVAIEKEPAAVMAGLLWEVLDVVGSRYVFVVTECSDEVDYKFTNKIIERNKKKIGLFSVSNEDEFNALIQSFAEACITDFYILANAYFSNVVRSCDKGEMFDPSSGFLIDTLLREYPQNIHIEEQGVFIDFNMFKSVKFQLENAVKKYERKITKLYEQEKSGNLTV